jgi:3,4-dihydroxy 2-butanone 4-phosphate synthase/GTP cyclohydrolase II
MGNASGCGWPLSDAMERISQEGAGVVVVLRVANDRDSLLNQLEHMDDKNNTEQGNHTIDRWTLGIGGQILFDLGVHQMRLLSAPQKFHGLGGFGLEIVEYVAGKE